MQNTSHKIERVPDVKTRTGLSRATVYRLMDEGQFPKPIKLGARAVGWLSTDIDKWIAARAEASRKA